MAHRSALIGQQQPGRPVGVLFSSHLSDASQAADWSTGPGERPDGSVERLVGCGGRLDIWKLLEVQNRMRGTSCMGNSTGYGGLLGMPGLRGLWFVGTFGELVTRHYGDSGDFRGPEGTWKLLWNSSGILRTQGLIQKKSSVLFFIALCIICCLR